MICSASKIILATGVMMLVEEGRLGLDDPINKYITFAPRAWKDITIRHLLAHTSGIPDLINGPIIVKDVDLFGVLIFSHYLDMTGDHTEKSLVNALAKQPLQFPPGSRHAYSNSGYEPYSATCRRSPKPRRATCGMTADCIDSKIFPRS